MNPVKTVSCFIDESGTLPDPLDTVIVLAAVGTDVPRTLENIDQIVRKNLRSGKNEIPQELKFYHAGDRTKRIYLTELARAPIDIFALVVEKDGQSIPDTPENYAVLSYLLLDSCRAFYREHLTAAIFDQHFHREVDRAAFDHELEEMVGKHIAISHVESTRVSVVNAADMIAGSLRWKHTKRNTQFYNIIHAKIVSETILHWKEAKRRFFEDRQKK